MSMIYLCLNAFYSALKQVMPNMCVRKSLSVDGNFLTVNGRRYSISKNVHIIAFGKAAAKMVEGAENILEDNVVGGVALVPFDSWTPNAPKTRFYFGADDNLPDKNSIKATQSLVDYLERFRGPQQIILFLISGGGSALLCSPISGISLEEKLHTIKLLSNSGADIKRLNKVRTALSNLKGGKLAKLGYPSKMISLIISDVIGDPISFIASGPTAIDSEDNMLSGLSSIEIVRELNIENLLSPAVLHALSLDDKSGACTQSFDDIEVNNFIVGSNQLMLQFLLNEFEKNGVDGFIVVKNLEGDASILGERFFDFIQHCFDHQHIDAEKIAIIFPGTSFQNTEVIKCQRKIVFLFGGESTVSFVQRNILPGAKGGRNQELILSAFSKFIETYSNRCFPECIKFALFSLGTDGQDGPTDAAGAFVSSDDICKYSGMNFEQATNLKSDIQASLFGKNSYGFWSLYNNGSNLIKCGRTGTNFMDIQIVYIEFQQAS